METKEVSFVDCLESEDEDISESFMCCVCLDLLYKPIVLACGHVSCFWCVHASMSGLGRSSCPICRHLYQHFPTICELLHLLIVKMYPNAYRRRDSQILEKERLINTFSPQFDTSSFKSNRICGFAYSSVASTKSSLATEENNQTQTNCSGISNKISITDVLCLTCKKLLFRPAVLNCGHAFCETCITIPKDKIIICLICERQHPSDFPGVCLELDDFLEKTFPKDYAERRNLIGSQRDHLRQKTPIACSSNNNPGDDLLGWLTEHGPKVHMGSGCDYCGVYPILGTRYRCYDCHGRMGFDLCEKCYNTKSKLPGRFNQQHTAEHQFEVLERSDSAESLVAWLAKQGDDDDDVVDTSADESGFESINNYQENNSDDNEDDYAESNNRSAADQSNDSH